MKLLIISLLIACSYGEKLDRTYLPPENAASAGGSPGSLTAPLGSPGQPFRPQGFGKPSGTSDLANPTGPDGLSPSSRPVYGPPSGSASFDKTGSSGYPGGFGQPSGPSQNIKPLGSQGFGQQSTGSTGFRQPSAAPQFGQSPDSLAVKPFDLPNVGQPAGPSQFGTSSGSDTFRQKTTSAVIPSGKAFEPSSQSKFGPSSGGSYDQTSGIGEQGTQGAPSFSGQDYQQPERPQAAADRTAEILRYDNENDGENFAYSFETSNGIAAEESGVATDGVKAQGGYSYTGDDGQFYQVTYTADENGFVPQGDHLPTSPPIPEEILKSLEENARAAAAGTQEGAYQPGEEESDGPQQNIGGGSPSDNQPRGQGQPFNQYGPPNSNQATGQVQPSGQQRKTPTFNQPQGRGQSPAKQYGAPSSTSQSQGGNQNFNSPGAEFDQQSQIPSTDRQNNAPVNTRQRGKVSQTAGLPSFNQGGSADGGYTYNQPQNQGQGPRQQSESPRTFLSSPRPGGFSNSNSQGQLPQQYNGRVNTQKQGQVTQQPGSQSYNQGGSTSGTGYNYDQPQNQPQGPKQGPRAFNTDANPTRTGGFSNVVAQGQTPQRYNSPVNTQQQSQVPQQSGSSSYNQGGGAAGIGYNYNQPQNQPQGPKQVSKEFNTNAYPTQPGVSSNVITQGQTPQRYNSPVNNQPKGQVPQQSDSPSYNQGSSAAGTGYNYDQLQNQPQGPKQGPGSFKTDANPTRLGGSLDVGNQGQAPQQSGASSFDIGGSAPNTGYNYDQEQNTRPQHSSPSKGTSMGAAAFPNVGNQGQLNQQGQGRTFGNQASTPGKQSPRFPNEGAAAIESQAQPGYQYNRPAAQGASQFDFNQDSSSSNRPQSKQSFGTKGLDSLANRPGSERLPHSGSASFRPSLSGQTSQSSFGPASSTEGEEPNSSTSFGGQKSFGSPARAFMPQSAPYQYNQPGSPQLGSQFQRPSSQPEFNSGSASLNQDKSEFGGPREPPSFSPEEGYKY